MNEQADFDWALAEEALRHSRRDCASCEDAPNHTCDVHRCSAITGVGTRCRNAVADDINPMFCRTHMCCATWTLAGDEEVTCTGVATTQTLPDGRRLRVCDQHHAMLSAA